MVNKTKLSLFALYSIILVIAALMLSNQIGADHKGPVINDKTAVKYNIIDRNVMTMPVQDLQNSTQCLYSGIPSLGIVSNGDDDYTLSAGLCDRKWQKVVNIKPRDSPENMIIAGPFIDTRLRIGAWAQYYRLFGRIGLGGGIILCRDYAIAQGGVLWMW